MDILQAIKGADEGGFANLDLNLEAMAVLASEIESLRGKLAREIKYADCAVGEREKLKSILAEKDKVINKAIKHLGAMLTYTMRPGDSSMSYTEKKQMAIDFIAAYEAKGGK